MNACRPFLVGSRPPGCRPPVRSRRFSRTPNVSSSPRRARRLTTSRATLARAARGDLRAVPAQPDAARGTPGGAAARARSAVADHSARRAGGRGARAVRCVSAPEPCRTLRRWRTRPAFRARWRARSKRCRWRWCRSAAIRGAGDGGGDLAALLERFDEQFHAASAVDRSRFLSAATRAVAGHTNPYANCRLLLIDVPIANATERAFVEALVARAPAACATTPDGDDLSRDALARHGLGRGRLMQRRGSSRNGARSRAPIPVFADGSAAGGAARRGRAVFSAGRRARVRGDCPTRPPRGAPRRALRSDGHRPAVAAALRGPARARARARRRSRVFRTGHAAAASRRVARSSRCSDARRTICRRAVLPNTSRSARCRRLEHAVADTFPSSSDEVFGVAGERAEKPSQARASEEWERDDGRATSRLRAPWKWERLLAESRVIATEQRWERRLSGLVHECELQQQELTRTDPGSPRIDHLTRKIEDIRQLAAFALPLMRTLGSWPAQATWGEWLERFELAGVAGTQAARSRASRARRSQSDGRDWPDRPRRSGRRARRRLASIEAEPPARRYGRVLVTTPTAAARPQLRRRVRAGPRRAAVSAEAARRSAAARRCARDDRYGRKGAVPFSKRPPKGTAPFRVGRRIADHADAAR